MLEATRLHLLANVVGTEGGVGIGTKHTAAMTFAVDVLARRQSQGLGMGDDRRRKGDPTPRGFLRSDLIPWELPREMAQ